MRPRFVLDAWAILALLQKEEPAASRVRQLFQDAGRGDIELYISVINIGEVYYRVGRTKDQGEARETLEDIRRLPLAIVPATEEAVFAAAELKMRYALSYVDAFAAAAAEAKDAVLVSGDPEFGQLEGRIRLERLVRRTG